MWYNFKVDFQARAAFGTRAFSSTNLGKKIDGGACQ